MHKNLRTGGDCEGVFTEFLFLKGKKKIKQSLVNINRQTELNKNNYLININKVCI